MLVLSPHRDDAAFSLAISISHWLDVGHRVNILNVFTRSLYAPYSDAESVHPNDRLAYVSALRRREDTQFLKRIPGATMIDLNLKDAPIRLRCEASEVCDIEADPEDTAVGKIRKVLGDQMNKAGGISALVLPLGLGHHVDHQTVRNAALPMSQSLPCAFYEDLPYAMRKGVLTDVPVFEKDKAMLFYGTLSPVVCQGEHVRAVEFKRRIALLYASQIDLDLADAIANFSQRYGDGERLWANKAWSDLAGPKKLSTRQIDPENESSPS